MSLALTLPERLAHLIAALEAPFVRKTLTNLRFHPQAADKYLREMRYESGLGADASPDACFDALLEDARRFDHRMHKTGCFPASRAVSITSNHAAEAAMTYTRRSYVGGCSQAEWYLLAVKGVVGLNRIVNQVDKARNLFAIARYYAGDFKVSLFPGENLAHETIEALIGRLEDHWADLLVIDRERIVDEVGHKGRTIYVWVRRDGCGTWVSKRAKDIRDDAAAIARVSPDGARIVRRLPQIDTAA